MIWIIFLLLSILFTAKIWCPEPERAIPLGIFEVMLITYMFGVLDVLWLQPYIMAGIIIVFIGIFAFLNFRGNLKRLNILEWLWNICILGGVIAFAVIYFHRHEILLDSDYNYYASVVKYLWCENSFVGLEKVCGGFSGYQPIMALWHYYMCKCFGGYRDWYLFAFYAVFLYVCELPLIEKISNKKWGYLILSLIIFFVFPWVFTKNALYMSITVDMAVGFLFGYTMYIIIDYKGKDWHIYSVSVMLCSMVLGLSKSPAILFVGICLLSYILITCAQKGLGKKTKYRNCIIVPTISFMVIFSWKFYYKTITGFSTYDDYLNRLKDSITGDIDRPVYARKVIVEYVKMLFFEPLNSSRGITTVMIWGLVLLGILVLIRKKYPVEKCEKVVGILAIWGYGIFMLGHIWMYLYGFTENEALIMSAWGRYMSLYMIPVMYILLIWMRKAHLNGLFRGGYFGSVSFFCTMEQND